jgi:transcriptional regulator with XRE-family HTH domain
MLIVTRQPSKEVIEVKGLRRIRRLRDMTQAELATEAGLSEQVVGNLEAGRSRGYRKTWEKLADVLQVSVEELMEEAPEPRAPVPWEAAVWNAERIRRRGHADLEDALKEEDRIQKVQEVQWVLDDASAAIDQLYRALGGVLRHAEQWEEIRRAHAFYDELVNKVLQGRLMVTEDKKVLVEAK